MNFFVYIEKFIFMHALMKKALKKRKEIKEIKNL